VLNLSISEGMSSSLVEAMSLGVPLLVRGNEGNKSIIKDLVTGYIFNDEKEFYEKYKLVWEN
jgi:glycosyltransferase involved in cell wall biosynthesis